MKKCNKCQIEKLPSEFRKRKDSKDGLQHWCKICAIEYNKAWNLQNNNYYKQYRTQNKLKLKELNQNYYKNNKEAIVELKKQWNTKNRKSINERMKKYNQERKKIDSSFRILSNMRCRLNQALNAQNTNKQISIAKTLGCSLDDFKKYMESKFTIGMTWDNHGKFGWHIDHIIPCASFDLSKLEEQQKCFHYTNLQPLWWQENLKKNKY